MQQVSCCKKTKSALKMELFKMQISNILKHNNMRIQLFNYVKSITISISITLFLSQLVFDELIFTAVIYMNYMATVNPAVILENKNDKIPTRNTLKRGYLPSYKYIVFNEYIIYLFQSFHDNYFTLLFKTVYVRFL